MSTVLMGIGTAFSAIGTLQQARASADAAEYNSRVAEMEASAVKISGAREVEKLEREKRLTAAQQRAGYAKAGVRLEGSPFEVLSETATQYQLDIEAQKYTTRVGISRAQSEAQIARQRAGAYRTAGMIGFGQTLLTGIGKVGYGTGKF